VIKINAKALSVPEPVFQNMNQETLTFSQMFARIIKFIQDDPRASYRIAIGTDSQVKNKSYFVTAVLLHRVGKGAVGFLREVVIPRNINSLREKISLEISFTQEIAYMFTPAHIDLIYDTILSQGFDNNHLDLEIHLDIGTNGPTKELIKEMVNRVSGLGFSVKIKPYATAASSLANRYTK
jgi:predicted RNase H-related nuclease YkuK (DUF458 family)